VLGIVAEGQGSSSAGPWSSREERSMIPYQVDPSLHPVQPAAPQLDDGCSPPAAAGTTAPANERDAPPPPVLPDKSDF
jgi:hypothetical protein